MGISPAYAFSHRYSYYKVADKSPHAFIALRDILDYSDTDRFPTAEYVSADRENESRINCQRIGRTGFGDKTGFSPIKEARSDFLLQDLEDAAALQED